MSPVELTDGRRGGRGSNGESASSSINHSILYVKEKLFESFANTAKQLFSALYLVSGVDVLVDNRYKH